MPAYLPPITRRDFIARAAAVSAALGIAPQLFGAAKPQDEDTWALFSDIHIAADPEKVARDVNMSEHFRTVSREVLALEKRPAAVLVCGDCAFNTGEAGDYNALADLLVPLRGASLPLHLLLGNHDNREHFKSAFPKAFKSNLPVHHASVVKAGQANLFLLDSLEKTNSTPGLLGQEQLDWLASELDARKNKPAIVFAHHNLGANASINGLKDTEALLAILRPRKHVKAFVYGHTHNWEIAQDPSGIHLVNLPPTAYIFKDGVPSGWVLANLRKNGMALELRCIRKDHKLHGQKVELQWRA